MTIQDPAAPKTGAELNLTSEHVTGHAAGYFAAAHPDDPDDRSRVATGAGDLVVGIHPTQPLVFLATGIKGESGPRANLTLDGTNAAALLSALMTALTRIGCHFEVRRVTADGVSIPVKQDVAIAMGDDVVAHVDHAPVPDDVEHSACVGSFSAASESTELARRIVEKLAQGTIAERVRAALHQHVLPLLRAPGMDDARAVARVLNEYGAATFLRGAVPTMPMAVVADIATQLGEAAVESLAEGLAQMGITSPPKERARG